MRPMLAGRIMELGILLNDIKGIETHVLLHGNTGCLCVEVYEDKALAYSNRAFATSAQALVKIKQDMAVMLETAQEGRGAGNE